MSFQTELPLMQGMRIDATLKKGWRCTPIGDDQVLVVHPNEVSRLIKIASIKEGDELPRPDDELISFPPGLGGK